MALIVVEAKGLDAVLKRSTTPLDRIADVRKTIAKYSREVQRIATRNVSATPVTFNGTTFTIHRQTGKLARSIQVVSLSALSGTIKAQAEYAAAVEAGHRAIDMKPKLMGKTVPIPIKPGGDKTGATRITLKGSTGTTMGARYVVFRRVGPKTKGFIIPAAAPRPFMGAAAAEVEPKFSRAMADAVTHFIAGEDDANNS